MAIDLEDYFRAAARSGQFQGQLSPGFQAALEQHHQSLTIGDCEFYHTITFPDGRVARGAWDLRGHEAAYTGGLSFDGRRVVEFGPASGFLTAYFDDAGAEVTGFDRPFGAGPELVPYWGIDPAARAESIKSATRLRNSWWYVRRAIGFRAKAVYADIYNPPPDLGRYDIAFFGAVLLSLSNPFLALSRAAEITDEAIVVTEVRAAGAHLPASNETQQTVPLMLFNPSPPPIGWVHWWSFSPGAILQMLRVLGFSETTVSLHAPPAMQPAPPLFTVVGRRPRTTGASRANAAESAAGTAVGASQPADGPQAELPIPPPELRFSVAGTDNLMVFLELGRRAHEALHSSLAAAGIEVAELGAVLDFGCGPGRALRYWRETPHLELHGSDINLQSIAWARDNLPFARFATNTLAGGLAYPDAKFGLVYALSVFTHMPERMQLHWFSELVRVVRPGGLIYFTTHGAWYRNRLTPAEREQFDAGELVVVHDDQAGSNMCGAYHPESFVRRLIAASSVKLLEFRERGAAGNPEQDSWLVQKLPAGETPG